MEGKDAIIQSILSSARKTAEGILADANAEQSEKLDKMRGHLEERRNAYKITAEKEYCDIIERRLSLAALEGRKEILRAKQQVIDSAYYQSVSKLLNMTDNIYREFITELIKADLEDGDSIMTNERDAKRLSFEFVAELAKKTGKKISLYNSYHNDRGGVILVGTKYDKNFTFSSIIKQVRSRTEGKVAARLFGDSNE